MLENYVIACGIKGRSRWADIFTAKGNLSSSEEEGMVQSLERLNGVREQFVKQMEPLFARKETVGEKVRALYEFITANQVAEKLACFERSFKQQGDLSRAREYGQIYRLVMQLLEQIEGLLREERMDMKEFADILDAGFSEIEVGTIPQNVDRVVVGDIERTRLKEIKVLFFVGINVETYPREQEPENYSDIGRNFCRNHLCAGSDTETADVYSEIISVYEYDKALRAALHVLLQSKR